MFWELERDISIFALLARKYSNVADDECLPSGLFDKLLFARNLTSHWRHRPCGREMAVATRLVVNHLLPSVWSEGPSILVRCHARSSPDILAVREFNHRGSGTDRRLVHVWIGRCLWGCFIFRVHQGVVSLFLLLLSSRFRINHLNIGLAILANQDLFLMIGLSVSRKAGATRFATRRNRMVAEIICILVGTLVPIIDAHIVPGCANGIVV